MPVPRIITADPTWTIARITRAAIDLIDRDVVHVNVSTGDEALAEIGRGGCNLLITTIMLNDDVRGFELALRAKRDSPQTQVIVLADIDDAVEFDDETRADSPFVFLRRPLNPAQFARLVVEGLEGKDIRQLSEEELSRKAVMPFDLGPIPAIDLARANHIVDTLMRDVGAQAAILGTRDGAVLLERGVSGLNRDEVSTALSPVVKTTIDIRALVGGNTSTVQFYDGDSFDVYVLSVGLHHFLGLVFDGRSGTRQFGAVLRFGRSATQDLIALLGAAAFIIQPPVDVRQTGESEQLHRRKHGKTGPLVDGANDEPIEPAAVRAAPKAPQARQIQLDPISEFDASVLDDLDGDAGGGSEAPLDFDDLSGAPLRARGSLSWEEAKELGIISDE